MCSICFYQHNIVSDFKYTFQFYGANAKLSMNLSPRIIFLCFYSSVSLENINRFQISLILWKIAQGKAITKALKEANLTSSVPKPPSLFILEQQLSQTGTPFYTWEGSTSHSPNIPKLPLGNLQTHLYIWQRTLIF